MAALTRRNPHHSHIDAIGRGAAHHSRHRHCFRAHIERPTSSVPRPFASLPANGWRPAHHSRHGHCFQAHIERPTKAPCPIHSPLCRRMGGTAHPLITPATVIVFGLISNVPQSSVPHPFASLLANGWDSTPAHAVSTIVGAFCGACASRGTILSIVSLNRRILARSASNFAVLSAGGADFENNAAQ